MTQLERKSGKEGTGDRPSPQLPVGPPPPTAPTSAEVIGIKGACDGVAGPAVTPTL